MKFLPKKICADDLFEGKSHKGIAQKIAHILRGDECKIIGIDGEWGSGKSNLVSLIQKQLNDTEGKSKPFVTFVYDAWGHQTDLQRRTILEELTYFLVKGDGKTLQKGILDSQYWENKLNNLLAKKVATTTKTIPKLSVGIIVSFIVIILVPLFALIAESMDSSCCRIFVSAIPILILSLFFVGAIIKSLYRNRKVKTWKKWKKNLENDLLQIFYIYQEKELEKETIETISEDEPSSRNFKMWMKELDSSLLTHKLIIVFDNMDRLPKEKVVELWAAIHTFFSEIDYDNIKVIIPFDRSHIQSAFDEFDSQLQRESIGNDYIDKTFDVVFRVSLPKMSAWKSYFEAQWKEALGEELDKSSRLLQIYEAFNLEPTPRQIISFINEFVTIRYVFAKDMIPDEYVALFICNRDFISKNPINEIINPTYLGKLKELYSVDSNLAKYISALFYQINPEIALDVVYANRLRDELERKEAELLNEIKGKPFFSSILESAIFNINSVNIPTVILCLNENCKDVDLNILKKHYEFFATTYKRLEDSLQDYQKVLLAYLDGKIRDGYLKFLLSSFYGSGNFRAIDFYNSIRDILEIFDFDLNQYLKEKTVEPQDFIKFVGEAKDDYKKYKISCDEATLNDYLKQLKFAQLAEIETISYIIDDYDLTPYITHLQDFKNTAYGLPASDLETLIKRLKEVEHPYSLKLDDNYIVSFFNSSAKDSYLYYELIAMRIARHTAFVRSDVFSKVVNLTNEKLINEVASRVLYYTSLTNLLLNLNSFNVSLVKEVIHILLENKEIKLESNILDVIKSYNLIKSKLKEGDEDSFFEKLDASYNEEVSIISKEDVPSIPIEYYEDVVKHPNSNLTQHSIEVAHKYLDNISKSEWEVCLEQDKKECYLALLVEYLPQSYKDAFETRLNAYVDKDSKLPLDSYQKFLNLSKKKNEALGYYFKDIRDKFCDKGGMTLSKFTLLIDALIEYGHLGDKEESLRKIFPIDILGNDVVIQKILKYQSIVLDIYNKSEDKDQFKSKINSLKGNYIDDVRFVDFAKSIGISFETE